MRASGAGAPGLEWCMEIKDIVVFADGRETTAGTLEWAATLAQEHDAHLTAAFVWPSITAAGPDAFVRGDAIKELLDAYQAEVAALEGACRVPFEREARSKGLRTSWRSIHSLDDLVTHARYADVAIVARSSSLTPGGVPLELPRDLVVASGRPVILLPPEPAPLGGGRVLVAWNSSREAARAVADALPFLRRADAVQVLVVDAVANTGHGEEPGADIARHLVRHGAKVDVRRLSSEGRDVGGLILSEAASFGAVLLVMGAYGHSRFTEFVFGGVTRTALREAALPVLMSR
jgi:nucleotide-binding universal stress UspA family protein